MLLRETFAAGAFACNCSVLACEASKKAIVVDPGGEVERIAEIVAHHDLDVVAIVHTHAHLDHIYCTRDVREAHGGEVCLHKDDLGLYKNFAAQAAMFGWQVRDTVAVDRFVEHDEVIEFGDQSLRVIHTPGHTQGSICFEIHHDGQQTVLAGDTLFRRSIGRTDLPGGNSRQLADSIRTRLYTMDGDVKVVPGHGPETTIGEEAKSNPFVSL